MPVLGRWTPLVTIYAKLSGDLIFKKADIKGFALMFASKPLRTRSVRGDVRLAGPPLLRAKENLK